MNGGLLHSAHLGNEQLEQLSRQPVGAGEPWSHIENCAQCRTTLEKYRRLNAKFNQLAADGVRSTITMNCPDESIWLEVAAGTLPPDESLSYSNHAASCDACARKLQAAIRIFDPQVTEQEERVLDALPSFQKEAVPLFKDGSEVIKPLVQPRLEKKRLLGLSWRPFAYAFSSLGALILILFFGMSYITESLLARGYAQKGTLDFRIARASPPKEGVRGTNHDYTRPLSLVIAELLIRAQLTISPDNAYWLGKRGRLELIAGDSASAENTLARAYDLDKSSKYIAIDLASAHSLAENKEGLFKAEEQLLAALPAEKDEPEYPILLYNLAIVYELIGSLEQADREWSIYLQLDSTSSWADEARRRQQDLNEKRHWRGTPRENSSLEAWQIYLKSGEATAAEEILDAAVRNWLGGRYSEPGPASESTIMLERTLLLASKKLQKTHGDSWLAEILQTAPTVQMDRAFQSLRETIRLNAVGDFEKALEFAKESQARFRKAGSDAGAARAQLEEVYSYQRSVNAGLCLQTANQLESSISGKNFPWIKGQIYLDRASCMNMLGMLEEAKEQASQAQIIATNSKYLILGLRALGIVASQATTRGDRAAALANDIAGLQQYWTASYPIERSYQFYSDIILNAEALKLWHVVYDTGQEAARTISQSEHKELEATLRYHIAEAAIMLGERGSANEQIQQADKLFFHLPQNKATYTYKADGLLTFAKANIDAGYTDDAVALLERSIPEFPPLQSHLIASRFYQVKGMIASQNGLLNEAQRAYEAAVATAEVSLNDLKMPLDRLKWSRKNGASYKALSQIRLESGDTQEAFEIWESYKAALIRDKLSIPVSPLPSLNTASLQDISISKLVRVEELQADLRPTETLISYAFLPKGLTVWLLDKSGLYSKTLPGNSDDLRRSFHQFEAECSTPDSDLKQLQTHAKELYKLLIAPLANHLSPSNVLFIETDEDLEAVPFQALIDDSNRYLIEIFSMIDSPGAAFRRFLRSIRSITPEDKALLVGFPDISQRWKNILTPLPSAKAEVKILSRHFHNPLFLDGPRASYLAVKNGLTGAVIFHFAGHALPTKSGPALVVASTPDDPYNDVLTVSDLKPERLRQLQLALLAACDTARSVDGGVERLAYPFLDAAVPQTIVTRWPISSTATLSVMNVFYDQTFAGHTAPDSLRDAEVHVRLSPISSHPYYWAAFSLVAAK